MGQDGETIIIENGQFKILENAFSLTYDENDPVISWGDVKVYKDGFIEFNSINYNQKLRKSTVVSESYDYKIKDFLVLKFSFPIKWQYEISVYFYTTATEGMRPEYKLDNKDEIILPKLPVGASIDFLIRKKDAPVIPNPWHNYKVVTLTYYGSYRIKNEDSNLILISIPELTERYFLYYELKKEYLRYDGNYLWWRGNEYEKTRNNGNW